ncbi:DUF4129 domain-containing transglutaminase family protein [Arthrobacter sp. ZGTC412]|uniref:DUF4129 domain-containing transglutaminase family protein n=1 Tax=Arthrobacter sp. ZGTC412 TaxID=2058900 RepID=UPI0027D29D37|nr:transglutaminase domain-containing protein [Arthrobacter sp. ZGTC412]
MAVMARLEGIPSRIAVGYAPGRLTGATVTVAGQGPLPEYEVDARDAHAWPELYFQGLGWVPFEPTPSRGVVPDYATESSAQAAPGALENNGDLVPESTPAPGPAPNAAPLPGPDTTGSTDEDVQLLLTLLGVGGVLGAALLAASPHLLRAALRSRRLRPRDPGHAIPLAWSELLDLGTDYGVPQGPSETPRAYSSRLRGHLRDPGGMDTAAYQAVGVLTTDFERHRYGRPSPVTDSREADNAGLPWTGAAGGGTAARLAALEVALQANATFLQRLRATWLPPSVMNRAARILTAPGRAGAPFLAAIAKGATRSLHMRSR